MTQYRILTLEEIATGLEDKRLRDVMKKCKVSYPTLLKLKSGEDYDYNMLTLKKISKYLLETTPRYK